MNKKVWFFIDIDGCIMDNMFNNTHFYKDDMEKGLDRKFDFHLIKNKEDWNTL